MSKQKNIIFQKQVDSITSCLNENYITDKYNFSFSLEIEEHEGIESFIEKSWKELKKFKFKISETEYEIYYEGFTSKGVESLIMCNTQGINYALNIFSSSIEEVNNIQVNVYENHIKEKTDQTKTATVKISTLSETPMGFTKNSYKTMKIDDTKGLSKKFYPFINIEIFFNDFFKSRENILILAGETGVGKTKFTTMMLKEAMLKYDVLIKTKLFENNFSSNENDFDEMFFNTKINEKEIKVLYIKNKAMLGNEKFWATIKNSNYNFIVMDDLDNMLSPRDEEEKSEQDIIRKAFISNLLSFSDGIISSSTKFIITTNQDSSKIDKALLRPGRLFDILSFRYLTKKEALVIWEEEEGLNKDLFKDAFNDIETISQADLGSTIFRVKMTGNAGIKQKRYLVKNDLNISKTEEVMPKQKRKIGIFLDD